MKQRLFLYTSILIILTACDHNMPDNKSNGYAEYMQEGTVALGNNSIKTRTSISPLTPNYSSGVQTYWNVNDQLHFITTQGSLVKAMRNNFYKIPPGAQRIKSIDPTNPNVAAFDFYYPGTEGIDKNKGVDLYMIYGVDIPNALTTTSEIKDPSALIDPIDYIQLTDTDFPNPQKKIPFKVPLRAYISDVKWGDRPTLYAEHIGSLQIIEIENASSKDVTDASIGFDASVDDLWYYPKGSSYNVVTNIVKKGNGSDVSAAKISNLAPGKKVYFANWVVPKRVPVQGLGNGTSDEVLTVIDRKQPMNRIVPNGCGRTATNLVFNQTLPKPAVSKAKLKERTTDNPILPSMTYWYRLKWDGQTLILVNLEVLPWDVSDPYTVTLDPSDGI